MSQRPIMDAGPGINFFSLNKERLLFSVLGALSVPEIVADEILRKARQDERFAAAERVWKKLPSRLMEVLSDDATDELAAAVSPVTALLDGVYFPFGDDGKQSPIRLFRGSVRLRAFAALGRARDARGDKGGEAGLRDVGAGTAAAASGEFVEVCDGVAARSAQTVLIQLPAANLFGRVGVYNLQQSVD